MGKWAWANFNYWLLDCEYTNTVTSVTVTVCFTLKNSIDDDVDDEFIIGMMMKNYNAVTCILCCVNSMSDVMFPFLHFALYYYNCQY